MTDTMMQAMMGSGPVQSLLAEHDDEDLRRALVISTGVIAPQASGPSGATVPHYNNNRYETEKRQGLRRTNGARKLKKLTNRHLRIISMHLEGSSGEDIAQTIGCTFITVSRVLNDPLAVDLLQVIYKDRQGEIDALAGQAIGAVRAGLHDSMSMRIRLAAVDKFTKLKDSIGKDKESEKTAEDVVQDIFKKLKIIDSQVQINIGGEK